MISFLSDFFTNFIIVTSTLFICGDHQIKDFKLFLNGLLFLILFYLCHLLGLSLKKTKKQKNQSDKWSDSENDDEEEKCFSEHSISLLFDLNCIQQPEVYSAIAGACVCSVGAVLDWREPWTEYPWLSLSVGLSCALVCHVFRRILA
jgi:hypothetical protein